MSATQDRRLWLLGAAVVGLIVVAASWFMFISPTRSSTSSLHGQTADAQMQNSLLAGKIGSLKKQNDSIGDLRTTLANAVAALPADSGLPNFTRELSTLAVANGVGISNISVGTITPFGATGTSASGSPAGKLYSIPLTITSVGPAKRQFAFLKALQSGSRQVLVTATAFTPGSGAKVASIDPYASLSTSLTVFSAPVTAPDQTQLNQLLNPTSS